MKARTDRDAAQRNLDALKRLEARAPPPPAKSRKRKIRSLAPARSWTFSSRKKHKRYSKAEIARVEAQRDEADAAYAATQDTLANTNVRAPFDGIVYSLPVKQGGFVIRRRTAASTRRSSQGSCSALLLTSPILPASPSANPLKLPGMPRPAAFGRRR